jgi:hypothetical protein
MDAEVALLVRGSAATKAIMPPSRWNGAIKPPGRVYENFIFRVVLDIRMGRPSYND